MSKVDAWRKKDEEEKVTGQQQKTQSNANKPTGTTSIPKDNQEINGRTQQKSTASSLRTDNNTTTLGPRREESKQNVIRQSSYNTNQSDNRTATSTESRGSQRRNTFAQSDNSEQRQQELEQSRRDNARRYQSSLLDDVNSLPMAPSSGFNQLSNLDNYIQKNNNFDFAGKDTIGSSDHAAEDLDKILHDRDNMKQDAQRDTSTLNSLLSGAGSTALGILGDIGNLAEMAMPKKSTEGMTPDEIYNRAMSNAPSSIFNYTGRDMKSDYDAYKSYVLNRMESGDVTPDEIQKMRNLEDAFSKAPAHYLNELGGDARAINEGFAQGHEIANMAGSLAPLMLENIALGPMAESAGAAASTINNPFTRAAAVQGANLIPDVLTDTLPEVARNINDDVSAGKIVSDAAKNLALNEAANLGFEYAPRAVKAIANSINGSNTAKRAVEEAVPEVAEQVAKNVPEFTGNPYADIPELNVSDHANKAITDDELGALRDSIYDRMARNGADTGDAFSNLIRSSDAESLDYFNQALKDYDAVTGGTQAKQLSRLDDVVNGRLPEGISATDYGDILTNIDSIEGGLNRIRNLEGLSDLGAQRLDEAYKALDVYEETIRQGGDVKGAAKDLSKVLGSLDGQAKKIDGYDNVFSSIKGGSVRSDLYSNTGRIKRPIDLEPTPEEKAFFDELNEYIDKDLHARPANTPAPETNAANNAIPEAGTTPKTDIPKNDIPEAGVKAPKVDNKIPDLEEAPKYDRGPEGPLVDDGTKRERGYARSTRNNFDIPDEVAADFVDNPETYNVLHNKDTKEKAQAILDQGFDKAYADYKDLLNKKDPAAVPLGYDLAKQMIDNGDSSGAADLIRDMSKSLTESGQFSQAAAITLMKNDPMTALRYAEKEIDALNADGAKKFKNWTDFKLTDDEIKAFNELEPGDKEGIAKLYNQIGTRLGKEYPTTKMEKLLEARRIGMLFNVRTNVRNVGANVPTLGMRWASDRVDALGQNIAHIINPDFKVTQSLTGSGKEGRKLAKEVFDSDKVQALLKNTNGKYDDSIKGSLVKEKQMYKGTAIDRWIDKMTGGGLQKLNEAAFGKKGVQSIPETIRNATYKALELGDSQFVKENFIERLGSYIKAQGYKSIDEIPDEAIETAWEAAMKATYKDQSWAYKMIRDIKNGIGQAGKPGKVVSESLIPFVQAPGNIAARMVDYSPIGGANGIRNIIKGAQSGNEKAIREGINQLAQGATGSLALGIGVALHNAGLITGGYSQDKDKKAHEKNNGYREYALHVGDKYYTIDWAQPAFQTIMSGVLLADAINKSDQYDSDLLNYFGVKGSTAGKVIGASKEAAKTTVNAWFNASPLQSMQDLLGGTYEDASDIASKLWSVAGENFGGSYIPASVNAIAKTMDTTQRQTYDPSSKTASFVNTQIAKIPGLSKNLPAKYNAWGEEVKTANSTGEAAFNRFVNPGEGTTENKKAIDKELDRLFDATGNNAVYPQVAPNKVNGEPLTAKQVSELQKDMGEQSYKAATAFMDSDVYKDMTDEQKAQGYNDLYSTTKWAAQLKMTDPELYQKLQSGDEEALKEITGNGATMKKQYITGGMDAVLDDIKMDAAFDKAGINKSDKAKAIYEAEGEEGLKEYAEQKKTFDAIGAPETDKAKEIYETEGEEGLEAYTKYYNAAKEASGADKVTTAGIIKSLENETPEVQKEMFNKLMPKQADAAVKANERYANGAYKYYKYKSEADTNHDSRVSAEESHAYFDVLDIPGTEKADFDKAIRNAKTSIYDGTAKKSTSTKKSETKFPDVEATGNKTFDTMIAAKQKAREDAKQGGTKEADWQLSNGYNLKNTKTYQRAQAAGWKDEDFLTHFHGSDTDNSGTITKSEAKAYIDALDGLSRKEKHDMFEILRTRKSKNPY